MSATPSASTAAVPELPQRGGEKAASVAALATSSGAVVACASCCALPFALPATLLGTSGGVVAWVAGSGGWATVISLVVLAVAWLMVVSQTRRSRMRPARSTLVMLGASTVLTTVALLWSAIDAH